MLICWHRCADKGTGKKQDIKITGASTLGSDEVDRMVKDAEKFADEVRIPSSLGTEAVCGCAVA